MKALSPASVVVCAGGGLLGASPRAVCTLLTDVAHALGGAVGATRAVVDAGWFGPDRLIGASGASIDPVLYLGFGVAGTSFHEIGSPAHVVGVNTDPAAPLMARATLPLRTDAAALLTALAPRLRGGARGGTVRGGLGWGDSASGGSVGGGSAPGGVRPGSGHRPAGGAAPGVDLIRPGGGVHERLRMLTGVPTGPVRPLVPLSAAEATESLLDYLEECFP